MYAIWNDADEQVKIVKTCIDAGMDVNAKDNKGRTSLHHASIGGKARIIPLLC
jgi:ankyrin repeat protein